ncbi:hypothetical protein G6L85_22015 [Agrobacterium rhizogenes]|uniref:hypothetical protein n=1 Tax=Rhizobium rhizogenes TaxID=359 RepID=UPI0015736884|nr:hypothetical protein [Rhizobium rhizogenes]NTI64194.1 hypothetical protein [Rhizobium rhizogenes]
MTTIASTSYYTSATRYAGNDRSDTADADDAFALLSEQQETETDKAATDHSQAIVDSRPSTATVMLQGKLFTTSRIDVSDLKPINISELPEEQYQSFIDADQQRMEANRQYLENQYTQQSTAPDLSNYSGTKSYATVTVAGNVVATIDNQGVVTSNGALSERLQAQLPDSLNGTNGPNLAQARADFIAKMLGGQVEKTSTAITQSQFNALPSIETPQAKIDYKGLKNDPLYQPLQNMQASLENMKQMRAEYLAQRQAVD